MAHIQAARIPARLSRLGIDEMYYAPSVINWHERARRLQMRRLHKLYHLVQPKKLYGKPRRAT